MQAILRAHSGSPPGTDEIARTAIGLLRRAAPARPWNNPASWPMWRQLLSHVLAVTSTRRDPDPTSEDVAWLLDRAASYLHTRGEPRSALPLYQRAFHLRKHLLGEDHDHTLVSAHNVAFNLRDLGEYERARELNEDTLARRRHLLGEDDRATLLSANSLGNDLHALGEYERARQLNEDTLARYRRVLGEDHPYTLTSAGNLANNLARLRL